MWTVGMAGQDGTYDCNVYTFFLHTSQKSQPDTSAGRTSGGIFLHRQAQGRHRPEQNFRLWMEQGIHRQPTGQNRTSDFNMVQETNKLQVA